LVVAAGLLILAGLCLPVAEAGPKPVPPGRAKIKPKVNTTEEDSVFKGFPDATDMPLPYAVDPQSKRNEVVFLSRAPKETIKGKTALVNGTLTLNPKRLDEVAGRFSVAWKDIDTGDPMRNGHLQAAPWVDAQSHPEIVFVVTGFEPTKLQSASRKTIKGSLVGEMSMNGKAKEMKIRTILAYVFPSELKKGKPVKEGVGIRSRFNIELEDFGIKGKGVGLTVAARQKLTVRLFMARSDGAGESADDDKTAENKGKKKLAL
jgi:polyisoprenoid-binding protein YceI